MRLISLFYDSRAQGVSGKSEQPAQTPHGSGPNAAASVASA